MDITNEEKLANFFAESFKEVVLPGLERLQETADDMKEKMATQDDIYRLERRIEKIDDRLDRQGKSQENIQKRVLNLESHSPALN